MIDPRVVSGTRDILPALAIQRNWLIEQFRTIFERYGFVPIDTPVLERREVLYGKVGEDVQRHVFEVAARGQKLEESELALRFDLTVPLARFMARHVDELGLPFKPYHIGLVYRGERAQRGRYREFYQCDFDTVGSRSPLTDAEIGLVIHDGLMAVGVPAFSLRVNHRKILSGMLDSLSLNEYSGHVLRSLDKLEKIDRDALLDELQFGESQGRAAGHLERDDDEGPEPEPVTNPTSDRTSGRRILELDQARRIMEFVESSQTGRPSDVLTNIEKQMGSNAIAREGIDNLRTVCDLLIAGGVAEEHIVVQVGLARGLDYYTGVVFESMVIGHEKLGSVCSGGRYDELARLFTERQLPGVGASFGLDRLLTLMAGAGWLKSSGTIAPVLLVNFQAADMPHYLRIARELREGGIACELFPESKRLGEQFGYASSRGHRFAVIAGPDELAANVFALRDMTTRQQQKNLPRTELVKLVQSALATRNLNQ